MFEKTGALEIKWISQDPTQLLAEWTFITESDIV